MKELKLKIKDLVINVSKKPFLAGSILVLFGVNLYNFGQTIFHLIIGRLLGRSGYADFAAIVSILGIVIIVQQAFGLTIIKFVSSGKNEKFIVNFTRWVFLWSMCLGIFLSLAFLLLSSLLADFLHINQTNAILILSPTIILLVFLNTAKLIFQGLLKFGWYVSSHLLEVIIKLLLAVPFILLGWEVFGVMVAIAIAVLCSAFLTYFPLVKYIVGKRGKPPDILPLFKYSIPVFFLSIALTSMLSTDIILVKHFFSSDEAGLYAALAKLGSIAFFGATPVASVMFPLISRKYSKDESYNKVFYLSLLLVLAISISVVALYKIFPTLVIDLLFGSQFVGGSGKLWWFGVYMLLLGLAVLFTQFYLSIGKTKVVFLFCLAALLQAILIWFIHPTLLMVIQVSILSATLLMVALLVYFPYHKR